MNTDSNKPIIYQAENGSIELRGDFQHETLWATQEQIANVFGIERSVITKHISNVYKEGELSKKATYAKIAQVRKEGSRTVSRDIAHYSLDMIISVGYRVNSKTATNFRKWATQTLKQHITKGYTINETVMSQRRELYLRAIDDIKLIANQGDALEVGHVLEIIQNFSDTWFSLQSYDEETMPEKGFTVRKLTLDNDQLYKDVKELKKDLIQKGQATELFAQEKTPDALAGILGNVMQTAFGAEVYETLEEKASHLLYFVVKNHPFTDGNKRTGAFCFVWFLRQAGIDFGHRITPEALTALTLLVAQSDPTDKDRVIGLILLMFQKQ